MASPQRVGLEDDAIVELLLDLCVELQLEDAQYDRATNHYRAVGAFLGESGGPFAAFKPQIYPQGSIALQTAIKPVRNCEFDVDLVYEVDAGSLAPRNLYDLILSRLSSSDRYRRMVEPKERCVRLNYAGEFHMDILPAVRDRDAVDGSVFILDPRARTGIGQSNPRGYQEWFRARAASVTVEALRKMAPLPENPEAHERTVLGRAVQLIKRHRAIRFGDSDLAPRSVILTTLAGEIYGGEVNVFDALCSIVRGINERIRVAAPARIALHNPTRPEEHFTDRFTDASYASFAAFFRQFEQDLASIATEVMPKLGSQLAVMFGERETHEALRKRDVRDIGNPRTQGTLRVATRAGAVHLVTPSAVAASGISTLVRPNTFFGS